MYMFWNHIISIFNSVPDPVLFLLEELLDQSVVSPLILHTALPSVGALMKRLRPILVQDPLVDKNGQKYGMRLEK